MSVPYSVPYFPSLNSIQSNRGDQTNRSTRSYWTSTGYYRAGGETNRSGSFSVVGSRPHISRISSASHVQYNGDVTTRSSNRSVSSRKRDSSDTCYWGEGDFDESTIRRRVGGFPSSPHRQRQSLSVSCSSGHYMPSPRGTMLSPRILEDSYCSGG